MMNRLVKLGLTALVLGLSACTSTPVHYYTLLAPAGAPKTDEQAVDFLIEVLPVGIPAQLDQPQLVVRQGKSGLAVLENERWAAPLSDELRHALSTALTHHLQTQDIAGLAKPTGKSVLRIKLQIRRFDSWPGQKVGLEAGWSLGFADDANNARMVCGAQLEELAPGGYSELVRAQQRAIDALATKIAQDARNWASHGIVQGVLPTGACSEP